MPDTLTVVEDLQPLLNALVPEVEDESVRVHDDLSARRPVGHRVLQVVLVIALEVICAGMATPRLLAGCER